MDRRKFLAGAIAAPILVSIPTTGWTEYLPCGQMVQFYEETGPFFDEEVMWVKTLMRRRGIEYGFKCHLDVPDHPLDRRIDSMRRSLSATCYHVDLRDGFTTESDRDRYFE